MSRERDDAKARQVARLYILLVGILAEKKRLRRIGFQRRRDRFQLLRRVGKPGEDAKVRTVDCAGLERGASHQRRGARWRRRGAGDWLARLDGLLLVEERIAKSDQL